jgi:hypothetical protein
MNGGADVQLLENKHWDWMSGISGLRTVEA